VAGGRRAGGRGGKGTGDGAAVPVARRRERLPGQTDGDWAPALAKRGARGMWMGITNRSGTAPFGGAWIPVRSTDPLR
jgi:hypothetical protein